MKFYERLDLVERKKLVLGAVAFDAAMEGMDESKEECLEELRAIERGEISANLAAGVDRKNG